MKIQQKCDEKAAAMGTEITAVLNGTVFRHGDLNCGPYLRVTGGFVDLARNMYHPYMSLLFSNYTVHPNARVVLE